MAVNKLTYGGIQITFGIQAATPVINAPKKNLLLVGACYYIVDVFDSDGAFDADALLSGPAVLTGSAAMESPGGYGGSLWVNGVETVITFAAGTWTIGQVVARINALVTGAVASVGPDGTTLVIQTNRLGAAATLKMTGAICTYLKMTAGETVYGFGSYMEQEIVVPFTSLPDPRGILDKCVLDESSIDVYANVAGTPFHFDPDTAYERNGFFRASITRNTLLTAGGSIGNLNGSAANWMASTLRPWAPEGGFVTKFWVPGEDAWGYIPASNTDAVNVIKVQAMGARDGVDGDFKNSDIGDFHGDAGNGMAITVDTEGQGPGTGVVVTADATAKTILLECQDSATLQGLIDAVAADNVANKMVYMELVSGASGSTVVDYGAVLDPYGSLLVGGYDPVSFAGSDGVNEQGGEFYVQGDRLTADIGGMVTGDYIDLALEGGPRTRVAFSNLDVTLDDVIATINAAMGAVIAKKDVTSTYLVLQGVDGEGYYGFKSSLAIYGSNCLDKLFIKDTIEAVTPIEAGVTYMICAAADVVGVAEGDTIRLNGGGSSVTIRYIVYSGGIGAILGFSEPTSAFLPVIGEGPNPPDIDIVSQFTASDFTGHRHHGAPYMVQPNDQLFGQGTLKSVVLTSNTTVSTSGDIPAAKQNFTFGALEVADLYGLTDTIPYWYILARGCEDSVGATKPYPSLVVDETNNYLTLLNDSIVDSYGRSPVNPSYGLYAGYTALRQDISPVHANDRTKISGPTDLLDKLDPIAPLENPLGYAAYLAMLASGGLYEFYVLGVPSDDVAGYLQCVPIMKKYPDWCIVPLTDNQVVGQLIGSFVGTMAQPTNRRELVSFLTADIPEEEYSTTLGSAANCMSNVLGSETTLIFDPSLVSLTALLTEAGLDPDTLTADDGVFIQMSGGGASETQSLYKWLIASVDPDQNTAVVKIVFGATENTDAFYSTATPPVVSEADITMYLRGDEIEDDDTDAKLEALQALAATYASRRICLVPCSAIDVDVNGVTTQVANYFASAAIGGYVLAHPVEFPLSGYTLPGVLHVYGTNDTFVELDRVTGLFFLENGVADGTVQVTRQFTTDTSDPKNMEFSITSQLDSLATRVRDSLRNWRQKNTGEDTRGEQNMQVSAAIDAAERAREIKSARITALENHETLINVHNIIIEAEVFVPLGGVFVYIIA